MADIRTAELTRVANLLRRIVTMRKKLAELEEEVGPAALEMAEEMIARAQEAEERQQAINRAKQEDCLYHRVYVFRCQIDFAISVSSQCLYCLRAAVRRHRRRRFRADYHHSIFCIIDPIDRVSTSTIPIAVRDIASVCARL